MKIKYLTWLQEKTGKHEDHLNLPKDVETIGCLITYLENNKSECAAVFKNRSVIYTAVNNEIQQLAMEGLIKCLKTTNGQSQQYIYIN